MKITAGSLIVKSLGLIGCVIATCALLFIDTGSSETSLGSVYYYTNYSADDLFAAGIENESGSIVIAQAGGEYRVYADRDLMADPDEIREFFEAAAFLPLEEMVEGASSLDPQYGLVSPRAIVTIQDIEGGGLIIYIGSEVPGGGVYTCLGGDERVFVMGDRYSEIFLSDIDRFFDLSLYPSLKGDGLRDLLSIEAERDGKEVYRLEQVAYSDSSTAYFALTYPVRLLIGTNQLRNEVLSPLGSLSGIRIADDFDIDREKVLAKIKLEYAGGVQYNLLIGPEEGNETYVYSDYSDIAVTVPSAEVSFSFDEALDIVGSELLALNINSISTLRINDATFTFTGSGEDLTVSEDGSEIDADLIREGVLGALNTISVRGGPTEDYSDLVLAVGIDTLIGGEHIDLEFYEAGSRQAVILAGSVPFATCDMSAVDRILASVYIIAN